MRNLKKILALVLALMMVMSMMVTASATDFADDASINEKYAEAVGVLSGIGVIRGVENEDGTFNFNPTGTLTRAQAATIIAYAKEGSLDDLDILVDGLSNPFTDVPNWAKVYVTYAYNEGIIIGRNATTFDPNGTITGFELGKMLLIACGFNTNEDFVAASNWKVAVSEGLKNAGAWVGTDFKLSKELTREEACYLTFNMMNASPAGNASTYTVADKTFTDLVEAYQYCQALNAVSNGNYQVVTNALPTDSLMASVFGSVTKTVAANLGTDAFGRPEETVWSKGTTVIYKTYEEPLAVVTTGLDVTKVGQGQTWYGWVFPTTVDNVIYNGSVYAGDFVNDLKAPGMTVELFGYVNPANGAKIVDTIVAYDYYFATITNIASNGDITLAVREAGYVINNDAAATVTVSATKDAYGNHSADYLALAGYAKNDVVALSVKQSWEVNAWGAQILDVEDLTAVTGTVTSTTIKTNGTTPVYSQSSITFNGDKYTFANQYARQNIAVGAKGTLYTLNGLVLGFVADSAPAAASDVIYVVDHYTVYTAGTSAEYDDYGNISVPATDYNNTVWVQGINMNGEIVTYPVHDLGKTSTNSIITNNTLENATYTNNEGKILKYTVNADGIYVASAADNTSAITISLTAVSDGNLYYDTAEYIHVMGSKATLTVNAGSAVGAATIGGAYALYTGSGTNKTVTKVFYWTAEPVVSYENVFVNLGATTVPEKSIVGYTNAGAPIYGYTYSVMDDTATMNVTIGDGVEFTTGFYQYYVQNGLHVVSKLGAGDGVVQAVVDNIYNNYLTVDSFTNLNIAGVQIVDLTTSAGTGSKLGNNAIDAGETVWFIASGNAYVGYTVETIYIVG